MEKGNDWQLLFKTANGNDIIAAILNKKENMRLLVTWEDSCALVFWMKTDEELDKHLDYQGPSAVVSDIDVNEAFRDLIDDIKKRTLERADKMYGDKLKKLETNEKFNKWKGEICGK